MNPFIGRGTKIADNATERTILAFRETWEVSLQFYISLFETGSFKNILRLTNTNTDSGNVGDRIFAICVHNVNQQLRFSYDRTEGFANYLHAGKILANTWYNLRATQEFDRGEFMLRIFLNETMIHERALKYTPTLYDNVTVYMGDQFSPPPILGYVDQLNITTGKLKLSFERFIRIMG